jgi:hypothetical protein
MIDDKLEQGVFKIFRMTHEGELTWQPKPLPGALEKAEQTAVPSYFESEYQGRRLALFQRHATDCKHLADRIGRQAEDWQYPAQLALIGENGELLFEFPWSRMVQDLFDAVRYKTSPVDDFLDQLLKPELANEK